MVCAAACAALPFRSELAEAALAEVLGTLAVSVADTRIADSGRPELGRDDLRNLGEQPLPHLRTAMIEQHGAVGCRRAPARRPD